MVRAWEKRNLFLLASSFEKKRHMVVDSLPDPNWKERLWEEVNM